MDIKGIDSALEAETAARTLSKNILKSSSKNKNENSIYLYSETLGRNNVYSVHAIVDVYPLPSNRIEKIADDKLIGIYITGKEEVDLTSLTHYPKLREIVIGKDVIRVNGSLDLREDGMIDELNVPQRIQKAINGKEQIVTILGEDTTIVESRIQIPRIPVLETTKVIEHGESTL